jgi:phosphoribosylaminoimidazolecarboxamide formyltransferase/IMP cyclohydrolase
MRALLSVYDKSGLVEFAHGLVGLGFDLVASGGTATALVEAGLEVTPIEAVTGSPEMLSGRVKTLHPSVHGGILADRDNPSHHRDLASQGIEPIDLVVCNLYPFEASPGIENIDIGGPTMVRAAAKNWAHVGVVVDPSDYMTVLAGLRAGDGHLDDATRARLATKAFQLTAGYDRAIAAWLAGASAHSGQLPERLVLDLEQSRTLRYGENPHQAGALYRTRGGASFFDRTVQHSGIELSYVNVLDAVAAYELADELSGFGRPAAAIVKHASPCGAAVGASVAEAYALAFEGDPVSAFGGIVALTEPVDLALAQELVANPRADVLMAPGFTPEALELLAGKRKSMRVLEVPPVERTPLDIRPVADAYLVQVRDPVVVGRGDWKVVTGSQPSDEQWRDIEMAWAVCARTWSNAVVIVKDGQAVGIGGGQPNRVTSARLAAEKAGARAVGGVAASDAFFPFRDGLDTLAQAGVAIVVQTGGSVRDSEVIQAAEEAGITMIFTGERHFRH